MNPTTVDQSPLLPSEVAQTDPVLRAPVSLEERVDRVGKLSLCETSKHVALGLFKSKVFRALVITSAAVAIALLLSNPVGWIATAAGVSLLVAKVIFSAGTVVGCVGLTFLQNPKRNKLSFEATTLHRLSKKADFSEIKVPGLQLPEGRKILLGGLPNRLKPKKVVDAVGENGTVISFNEPWEKKPFGLSVPFQREHWAAHGIDYVEFDVKDHSKLTPQVMDQAADALAEGLKKGNVLDHCRAGVGRSATGIAAWILRDGRKEDGSFYTIEEVCTYIQQSRRTSIWNKVDALVEYDKHLKNNGFARPERSGLIDQMAAYLAEGNKKSKEEDIELATESVLNPASALNRQAVSNDPRYPSFPDGYDVRITISDLE